MAIGPVLAKRGIAFEPAGATRLHPEANEIELGDGRRLGYDYLVIATGPDLAFDEVPGLGPGPYPIHLPARSCLRGPRGLGGIRPRPRPGGDRGRAGRVLLWPRL